MININKNGVFLTPYKWTYEERSLYKVNNHYCFEKNYSKWACILIEKFKDIKILYETKMNRYSNEKNEDCYCIQLDNDGESYLESAEDTYYEHWWGNKSWKKEFEKGDYGYMDNFLESYICKNNKCFDDIIETSRKTAVISKKDYKKLKEVKDER